MLLMNKTLLKLAKGLWGWILAIAGVSFLTLVGTTALAEIVAGFLGSLFAPEEMLGTAWSAVRAALIAAVFTFLAQLLKGLLEYRTAAAARTSMRRMIFKKVLELDAGGIEKIGPVSAITASVVAVEQMQAYFSSYLPSLIYSVLAPIYLFFHLKDISLPVAALVGLSGCEKSTILRLLLRFYAPTEGEILINGIPLEKISFRELHQRITFLEQHPRRL